MLPKTTLVLGGAASGKSAYAESLTITHSSDCIYLATAQAFDSEMQAKISLHQNRRGSGWTTIEAPLDAARTLGKLADGQVCLLDCATLWLSNHLMAESDIAREQSALIHALTLSAARVVVVSNEVGHGIVPDNALARRFREAQGRLNIALAAEADLVVQVTAGLPRVLKGQTP